MQAFISYYHYKLVDINVTLKMSKMSMFFKHILFLMFFRFLASGLIYPTNPIFETVTDNEIANTENVTCTLDSVSLGLLTIKCWIYPSGILKEMHINNETYSLRKDYEVISSCNLIHPDQGQLFNTSECTIDLLFIFFRIGNNTINVTASYETTDSNFTMYSNIINIPFYDDKQEPVCLQPTILANDLDESEWFYGVRLTVKCLIPLTFSKVDCTIQTKSNGSDVNYEQGYVDYVIDEVYPVAVQCQYPMLTSNLGYGQQEIQATFTFSGDQIRQTVSNISSNWTEPVNFYIPTNINFTVNGSPHGVNLSLGENFTLNCRGDSFPPMVLLMNGERNSISRPRRSRSIAFTTVIQSCAYIDLYTCQGGWITDTLGEIFSKTVYVNMPCRYQLRNERNQKSNISFVGTFTNITNVKFNVIGYPKPISMRLSKTLYSNKFLSEADGVTVVYNEELGPTGTIEVNFKNTELSQNQEHFILNVDNGVGITYFDFYIGSNGNSGFVVPSICLYFVTLLSRFIM